MHGQLSLSPVVSFRSLLVSSLSVLLIFWLSDLTLVFVTFSATSSGHSHVPFVWEAEELWGHSHLMTLYHPQCHSRNNFHIHCYLTLKLQVLAELLADHYSSCRK